MKLAYKLFPERLITGTLSPAITGQKPPKTIEMASNVCFTVDDIDAIDMYLDNALEDNSIGSKCEKLFWCVIIIPLFLS